VKGFDATANPTLIDSHTIDVIATFGMSGPSTQKSIRRYRAQLIGWLPACEEATGYDFTTFTLRTSPPYPIAASEDTMSNFEINVPGGPTTGNEACAPSIRTTLTFK